MKNKNKLILVAVFLFFCAFAFAFAMLKLIQVNNDCVKNPFVYGANKIIDQKGDLIYAICSCDMTQGKFYFDNQGIYKEDPFFNDKKVMDWEKFNLTW